MLEQLNFFNPFRRNNMTRASIVNLPDGRYGLSTSEGLVGSYSRARDARRGAARLGLTV